MKKQNLSLTGTGKMLHAVYRVFKKVSDGQQQMEVKITTEQFGLLQALSEKDEDVIQKDMAEMMGKDKSAILRLIDSLEEKELVRRVADSKDRRKNYLMVTKLGYRIIDQYMKIADDMMEVIQEGLSQAEIDTFHHVVSHITNKAKEM